MKLIDERIALVVLIVCPWFISSISLDSLYLDLIHQNISDFISFNRFYQDFLHDIRQHRIIDTVSSPIKLEKLQSKNYDEDYLKNSCYETASDLLIAHGFNPIDLNLSSHDLQTLLPAILNTVNNPGCERQLPRIERHSFFHEWIIGFLSLVLMKVIHLLIVFLAGNHSSALTSNGISQTLSTHTENNQNPIEEIRFRSIKSHLWLGLAFNAFTCGILLGTVIYHLIPHIYQVPNENFDYDYLLRGTVILCGVFLFFIVEKLLRFRFKVDEMQFDQSNHHTNEVTTPSDSSMIQMARMHGTFHVHENDHGQHTHPESFTRLPTNPVDSGDEEIALQADLEHHKHSCTTDSQRQRRNMIIYHIIYDFSTDVIYGCGFATALTHDRLIGFAIWMMILSEGFRRHSQLLTSIGRKYGFAFLFISIAFLLIGYLLGGVFIQIAQQWNTSAIDLEKEYIYSLVYGALFYTALVTLIPELNDFGQHLQTIVKSANQNSKQRRLLKSWILICQNLFLLIGVLLTLILAIIWRYFHRIDITEYVCRRVPTRLFCPTAF